MFDTWHHDLRYAGRLLRRSPVFTLTAILSLTIGIGANTTIFSAASALLLRPLPGIAEQDRLVDIGRTQDGRGFDNSSYPNFKDVRERVTTLSGVYAARLEPQPMSLGGRDGAERIYGTIVSANYFAVLGTQPRAGRLLVDADDSGAPGSHPVMVISDELWQRRFGGDASVIGQTIPLNGHPFAIVGVTPPGFQGTTVLRADAWVPISATALASPRLRTSLLSSRESVWLLMGGRLRAGVTVAQAHAELDAIGKALEREFPRQNRGKGLTALRSAVVPGHIDVFAGFVGLLTGIVGLVLVIACVNLSGMLLARAAGREREIAVRLAIGASRARLIRQMLAETCLLFAGGCVMGLLVSRALGATLLGLLPALPVPLGIDMPIDWRVFAFSATLSFAAAIVSGLAPALQASRPDLVPSLKAEGAGRSGRMRLRSGFLVGQIALSLLLVLTAGLFLRALERAGRVNPGFDQANVDVVMLDLSLAGYSDETGPGFVRELATRTAAQSRVSSVALAADLPLDGGRMGFGGLRTPGLPRANGDISFDADWNTVSPGVFKTLNLRLVRGRDFTDADVASAPGVAIVNQTMARQIWGDGDPIGRTIEANYDRDAGWIPVTIVGVAADARLMALDQAANPYIYVPLAQRYTPRMSLLVKHTGGTTIPEMRALIRQMNPNLPVSQALPMTEVTAIGLIPQRILAAVAGSLGTIGLLLAAIGIYGVTSYNVSRRVREIGIRVALGADTEKVLRMVLRQGVGLTGIGVAIGIAAGALVSQVLRSLLFGISTIDPVTFAGTAVLFLAIAVAASYGPARRATRVDPMSALRAE